jgi:hypothetical protein
MTVELTNQVTGEKRIARPYLDGSVTVPQIDPGQWRVQVKHPNLVFDVFDRPIRVLPDRPTFVPVTVPTNIFENVPIADTPLADLGPVQAHLDDAAAAAEGQANKQGGQPIYADDWNHLSHVVRDVAKSTRDLTTLVSPIGHDHPELVSKIEEVQRNLQTAYDTFGQVVAQIQRQIEQLALQAKVNSALDRMPAVTPQVRTQFANTINELQNVWSDSPGVYSSAKRRTGEKLQEQFSAILAAQTPEVRQADEVKDFDAVTSAMAATPRVVNYQDELIQHQRITSKSSTGLLLDAFKVRGS